MWHYLETMREIFPNILIFLFFVSFNPITSNGNRNNTNDSMLIWRYDCNTNKIQKIKKVNSDTMTWKSVVSIVNCVYQNRVHLDYVGISHDTIIVKIKESEYLTEQMGTCGADEFMISTTFSLTELKDIHFVTFDFDIGDHASPGTYSRMYYFERIKKSKK